MTRKRQHELETQNCDVAYGVQGAFESALCHKHGTRAEIKGHMFL
jgi:hypothetical protein